MRKLIFLNKAFYGGEVLVNTDAIASAELCDSGFIHVFLVNGIDYVVDDFCLEENPLMEFFSYVEQAKEVK